MRYRYFVSAMIMRKNGTKYLPANFDIVTIAPITQFKEISLLQEKIEEDENLEHVIINNYILMRTES